MSEDSGNRGREALVRLQNAVEQAVVGNRELTVRLRASEEKARELDGLLKRISGGEIEPGQFVDRMRVLEEENSDLRTRLERGREGVERLLARIRFLEEQR